MSTTGGKVEVNINISCFQVGGIEGKLEGKEIISDHFARVGETFDGST